ncbi:MAG TPA: histidine kinase [Mucilaginibacter sp.]
MRKKDWIEAVFHIAFWVGVFYTLLALTDSYFRVRISTNGTVMEKDFKHTLSPYTFFTLGFLMLLFYGNIFWILRKILKHKNIWGRIALGAGWFLTIFLVNYYLENIVQPSTASPKQLITAFQIKETKGPPPIADHIIRAHTTLFSGDGFSHLQLTMSLIFLGIFGLSIAYFFLKEWARAEQIRSQLETVQLDTEIKFLKSQVNPHFLFNTLNNLFSMAQKKNADDLADGISKLSDMMRYMIYESNAGQVPLKNEIAYLEDCITLNKLRYDDNEVIVSFSYPADTAGIVIAPMLFIPFVENAFKHGVLIGASSPIDISITAIGGLLIFTCQNTNYRYIKKMESEKSGIGLENVKRRLELVYPGKHRLTIGDDDGKYTVKLEIELK